MDPAIIRTLIHDLVTDNPDQLRALIHRARDTEQTHIEVSTYLHTGSPRVRRAFAAPDSVLDSVGNDLTKHQQQRLIVDMLNNAGTYRHTAPYVNVDINDVDVLSINGDIDTAGAAHLWHNRQLRLDPEVLSDLYDSFLAQALTLEASAHPGDGEEMDHQLSLSHLHTCQQRWSTGARPDAELSEKLTDMIHVHNHVLVTVTVPTTLAAEFLV